MFCNILAAEKSSNKSTQVNTLVSIYKLHFAHCCWSISLGVLPSRYSMADFIISKLHNRFLSHIFQWLRPSRDIPHVLFIAAMPVAIFSFWLALAKGIAYGDLRLIFCPEVFIASSETPAGDHQVLKFAPQSDGVLMHSTHSNAEALQNVAQWLYCSEKERKNRNP
jgi:hypothetical protein